MPMVYVIFPIFYIFDSAGNLMSVTFAKQLFSGLHFFFVYHKKGKENAEIMFFSFYQFYKGWFWDTWQGWRHQGKASRQSWTLNLGRFTVYNVRYSDN